MKLREHPLMSYRGMTAWPPVWIKMSADQRTILQGEIGVLENVILSDFSPATRCYLIVEFGGGDYMGSLLIDNWAFCRQMCRFLEQHIGASIKEISDLDVSFSL